MNVWLVAHPFVLIAMCCVSGAIGAVVGCVGLALCMAAKDPTE